MPYTAGSYALYTPGNPVVTGTTIASTWANNTLNDIATALSTCLLKDGSQTVTANIPMAGFKFTGLGAGSAAGQSVRYEQPLLLAGNAGAVAPSYLGGTVYPFYSGLIFGLTLSTAGASTTMTVATGVCSDTSVTAPYLMRLAASIGKTTAAWAVGTGNGGLDTGVIANSTWYHFYLIARTDTGVVDVLFSLSATAPTMPANYTQKRRIGSGKTDGGGNWTAFTQDGDLFQWSVPVNDVNATNPGSAAVARTLTVPTGVNVIAQCTSQATADANGAFYVYYSDLATTDTAAGGASGLGQILVNASSNANAPVAVRTNTSAQIRSRLSASFAGSQILINTLGWLDSRGRLA